MMSIRALAADELPRLVTIEQIPYSFMDEKGKKDGYQYLIADAILRQAGYKAKSKMVPLKRLVYSLQGGAADCGLLAGTPYVKEHFAMIEPVGINLTIGVVPRRDIILTEYKDLHKIKVGVGTGVRVDDRFDHDPLVTKMETKDYASGVLVLQRRRVDGLVGVVGSIKYSALKQGLNPDVLFGEPLVFSQMPMMLICAKSVADKPFVKRLKSALVSLKAKGEIQKILDGFYQSVRP
ncbi:conserved hypothetical protein [Candidatus Terasakiella magnetica]|uniref:Solute-binding protein family 3/N-terminal domain-containing protein n=1 Tax=Candidatus Terasakiella magnetica TaxID=1867952 RepID=A0A1C3RI95_9PROT|nr:transporter substrate-binding domain-containing protein [Candidatus Terasakiella magnetica]SCA57007.1 conserved hypothetical protein [Candidatus Terasakiella magnetica]